MAIRINATGEYLKRTASLPSGSAWSMSCWFYVTAQASVEQCMMILQDWGGSQFAQLMFNTTNQLVVDSNIDSTVLDATGSNWQDKWVFAAITANGSVATAYVWRLTDASPTTNSCNILSITPNNMFVGSSADDAYTNGKYAHIKVWDAALTQAVFEQERWSAKPVRRTNLHLWSPLIVDSHDYSGAGKDWTEGGTLTYEDGPPVGWGGVKHVIGAPALVNPIFALTALQSPVAGTCTMRVRAKIVV